MFKYVKNRFYDDLIYDFSLIMSLFNIPNRLVSIPYIIMMILKTVGSLLSLYYLSKIDYYNVSEPIITIITSIVFLLLMLSTIYMVKEKIEKDLKNNIYIFGIPNKFLRINHIVFLELLFVFFKQVPEFFFLLYIMFKIDTNYTVLFSFNAILLLLFLLKLKLYKEKYKKIHSAYTLKKKNIFLISYILKVTTLLIMTYHSYEFLKGFLIILKESLDSESIFQDSSITKKIEIFIQERFSDFHSLWIEITNFYLNNYIYILFSFSFFIIILLIIYNLKLGNIINKNDFFYVPSKLKKELLSVWNSIINKFYADEFLKLQLFIIKYNRQLLENDHYTYVLSTPSIISTWLTVLVLRDVDNDIYTLIIIIFSFLVIIFNIVSDTQITLNSFFRFEDDKNSIIYYRLSSYGILSLNEAKKKLLIIINILPTSIIFIIYVILSFLFIDLSWVTLVSILLLIVCYFWGFKIIIDSHQSLMPYLFSKKITQYGINDEYQTLMSFYENKIYFKFTSFWRKTIFIPYVFLLIAIFLAILKTGWIITLFIILIFYILFIIFFYYSEQKKLLKKGDLLFGKINF